jgi:hypothetical protein
LVSQTWPISLQLDPDQLAALRRLRAAFGPIEVLEVLDHNVDRDQAATQSDVETFTGLLHPAEPL